MGPRTRAGVAIAILALPIDVAVSLSRGLSFRQAVAAQLIALLFMAGYILWAQRRDRLDTRLTTKDLE